MSTVSSPTSTRSPIGVFSAEAHAAHLASWAGLPAWLAERKRKAHTAFASLPLPRRTDEMWRFSDITEISLEGIAPSPAASQAAITPLAVKHAAEITFVNNVARPVAVSTPLPAGVIVTTLAEAAVKHADLVRAHFMAQPQKLGSEKFAALHTAFVRDGAFIYVPRGIELPEIGRAHV